jgi:hypothetical protein
MKIALLSGLILLGVVLFGGSANATHSDSFCFPLRGTLQASFIPPTDCSSPVQLCTQGQYRSASPLFTGTTSFYATGIAGGIAGEGSMVTPPSEPPTTSAYSGVLTIAMKLGSFNIGTVVFKDVGVLDLAPDAFTFAELERPISGTGWFEGVTGRAFISGVITPDGNGFDGAVTGELCMPN